MASHPPSSDRVTELYRGEIFTSETQRICQRRIHWICSRALRERVVDIGCSQGIASVLLAQEGFQVTGLDSDPNAIEFAREEVSRLPENVASRIEFINADMVSLDPEMGPFDTAIIGEFLEHFVQPEEILRRCLDLVRDGGRVVITVPFGVHPHEDHRITFTLTSFVELIKPYINIHELDVVDGFIRLSGDKVAGHSPRRRSTVDVTEQSKLLELTEKGLLFSQYRLFGLLDKANQRNQHLLSTLETWRKRAKKAETGYEKVAEEASHLREELAREQNESAELLKRLDEKKEEVQGISESVQALERRKAKESEDAGRRIRQLEEELDALRSSTAYQLGVHFREAAMSPSGFVSAPFRISLLLVRAARRSIRARFLPPLPAQAVRRQLERRLRKRGVESAEAWAARIRETRRASEASISKIMFALLKDSDIEKALHYGERALELDPDNRKLALVLAARYRRVGDILRADELMTISLSGSVVPRSDSATTWSFSELRSKVQGILENHGLDKADEWCDTAERRGWADELTLNRILFALTRRADPLRSLRYGERALELEENDELRRALSSQYRALGQIRRALQLSSYALGSSESRQHLFLRGQLHLLDHGYTSNVAKPGDYDPKSGRVFYLLHNSLPYSSGGYATRSHGLATAVREEGVDLEVVTRLGFPLDLKHLDIAEAPESQAIERVPYLRLLGPEPGYGGKPLPEYLDDYTRAVVALARERRPSILHGASNYMNGVVANAAAKVLAIPSIYEVRGLWEITRISRQPEWKESDFFRMLKKMETQAACEASAVITITEALRREMITRGVAEEKIIVVPNAVDPDRFRPQPRDRQLAQSLGLLDRVVIGYVGSIVDYEGLDQLLEAVALLRERKGQQFSVLIVGDGAAMPELREQATHLELDDLVHFTGRVPHSEVERYYSVMDILPYPRKPLPVCEIVSPIKPFEAMSMEKAIVSSDVAALREIVTNGVTGLVHDKRSVPHLAECLRRVIDDSDLRQRLGRAARKWVIEKRSWPHLAVRVCDLYAELAPSASKNLRVL